MTDNDHKSAETRSGIPGTLLAIDRQGLLITGESGSGKSLLALGLLDRGHTLVSDDLVELEADAEALFGQCPALLQGRLEVRGVGLVDVRQLFGPAAWRPRVQIKQVLHLQHGASREVWRSWPRPDGQRDHLMLHGVTLPRLTLLAGSQGVSPLLVETGLRHDLMTSAGGVDDG